MDQDILLMQVAIRDRLFAMSKEYAGDLAKLLEDYSSMNPEAKSSPFYKSLGEKIGAVEGLFNTLISTAESFR